MMEPHPSGLCQQLPSWQDYMSSCMNSKANPMQVEVFPTTMNPHRDLANAGPHGYEIHGLLEGDLMIKSQGLSRQQSMVHLQSPFVNLSPSSRELQLLSSARVDWKPLPLGAHTLQRKKFLIFDRSGDETRLVFSSVGSIRNQTDLEAKPAIGQKKHLEEHLNVKSARACPETPILCEESGENHVFDDEGSDYREDTDEINALLYSEDNGDDEGHVNANSVTNDEDEVSTGHSPLAVKEGLQNPDEGDDINDEVTSLDFSSKRQKLPDGGCSKLSFINTGRGEKPPPRWYEDESVVDLNASHEDVEGPISGNKRSRKDKIRDTMRVIGKLIPGPKSEDPLAVIDRAIDYLKQLKVMAEYQSLLEHPGSFGSGAAPSH